MPPIPQGSNQTDAMPGTNDSTNRLLGKYSPAMFGLALLCFFLPFTHISCQGERVATLSGLQLATGSQIDGPDMSFVGGARRSSGQRVGFEPLAILALLSALGGLGISFLKNRPGRFGSAVAGGIGFLAFVFLKLKIDREILQQGDGILQAQYGGGFYLGMLVFLCAAVLHVILFRAARTRLSDGRVPGVSL